MNTRLLFQKVSQKMKIDFEPLPLFCIRAQEERYERTTYLGSLKNVRLRDAVLVQAKSLVMCVIRQGNAR